MNFEKRLFNKVVLVFFMVILMSAIGSFNTGIAEAKNVDYKVTNIALHNGKCVFNGYFYNSTGVTVTRVKFFGTITTPSSTYHIDQAFDNVTVGYIPAGSTKSWSFTINQNIFSYYNGNPNWDLKVRSTFH